MVNINGTGQLKKVFPTSALTFTFPIGETTGVQEYSPVTFTSFISGGAPTTIGARVIDDVPPGLTPPAQPNHITRYWSFTEDVSGSGYSYNAITLNYITATDVVGTINTANVQLSRRDGSNNWYALQPTTTMTATQAVATRIPNFDQLSGTLGGNNYTLRNNPPQTYTWLPTSGSEDWNVPTNWSPSRFSPAITDVLLFSSGGTTTAYDVPTQTIAQFLVSNNTNITLQPALVLGNTLSIAGASAATNLSIASGSTLQISNAITSGPLTINFTGSAGQLVNIAGTLRLNFNGTFTPGTSVVTVTSSGTYHLNWNSAQIYAATWQPASTLLVNNVTGSITIPTATGVGSPYGNITWDAPGSGTFNVSSILHGNLNVNQGTISFGALTITMNGNNVTPAAGNVVNNGIILTGTGSTLNMHGANGAQTISGSGNWNALADGAINGLSINNPAGVNINTSVAIRTTLNLTAGVLNASTPQLLTIGVTGSAVNPLTVTRTNGSLGTNINTAFSLIGITYNLTYGVATAQIASGRELPPDTYNDYRLGTFTVSNTNGGARLTANANVNAFSINAATASLDLDNRTLRIFGSYSNIGTGINGLIANASNSTIFFNGNTAQTFLPGVCQGLLISNLIIGNTNTVSGITLSASWPALLSVGNLTINPDALLTHSGFNLSIRGNLTNNGMVNTAATGARFIMDASTGPAQVISGSGIWTTGVNGRINNLTINNSSGLTPAVNFNINAAIQSDLYLQEGELSGTGTLTQGVNAGIFNMRRHAGSMRSTFVPLFDIADAPYNAFYGNNLAPITITMGNEFPYAPTHTITSFTGQFNATGGRVNLSGPIITRNTGVVSLTNTVLVLGNHDLTITNPLSSALTGTFSTNNLIATNTSSTVSGFLRREVAVNPTGAFVFPVGDLDGSVSPFTRYAPMQLTFTSNSLQRQISIKTIDGVITEYDINGPQVDYAKRHWLVQDSEDGNGTYGFGTLTNSFRLDYSTTAPTDVEGAIANYKINRWDGANWSQLSSTVSAPGVFTNVATNNLSARLNGVYMLRNNPFTEYTWLPTDGNVHDFNDPDKWSPQRFSPFITDVLKFTEGFSSTATNVPTQAVGRIQIANSTEISLQSTDGNRTLTLGNAVSPLQAFEVEAGSKLNLTSTGTNQINIAFASVSPARTVDISGVIDINANDALTNSIVFTNLLAANNVINGTINNNGGLVTSTSGTTTMNASAIYNHNRDGSLIPGAIWNAASLVNVNGIISTNPTGISGQTFGRVTYNSSGQTASINLGIATTTAIAGDFTISNTGTPTANDLIFGANYTLNLGGHFNINNGSRVILCNGGTTNSIAINLTAGDLNIADAGTFLDFRNVNNTSGTETMSIFGNYNQTNGTVTRTGTPSTGSANIVFTVGPNRNFTQSAGALTTNGWFNFAVNTGAELTLNNNIDLGTPASGTRVFTNNGTLWLGNQIISGDVNTSFVNTSAASVTLGVGHAQGIAVVADGAIGNIRTGTTRTYGTLANYNFYGSVANTGSGFIGATNASFDGVTANLTSAATLATSGSLNLTNSRLLLGNNDLTFANAAHSITGTFSDANMVVTNGTGRLVKPQAAIGSPTTILFPIGTFDTTDGYEYTPASIEFISAVAGTLAGRVIKGSHPDIAQPSPSDDFLERWWKFDVTSLLGTYTINQEGFKLFYKQNDFDGSNENLMTFARWNTVTTEWNPFGSLIDDVNNIVSAPISGTITNTTPFFNLTGEFTGRNTPIQYHYRSVADGNWNDPAIWEISTDPLFLNPVPVSATTIGLAPTASNSLSILVRLGHQVAVTANVTADQLSIDNTANSRLTVNNGVVFTLADGPGNDLTVTTNSRLDVNGTLVNFGQISGSTSTISNFFAGSVYDHRQNAGTIPTATWNVNSTCLLESITSAAPTAGLNNTFGNFTWNNAGQVNNIFLNGTLANVTGNLTVSNTGNPTANDFVLTNGTLTLNIGGNFNINNNSRVVISSQTSTSLSTINLIGDLNISGSNTLLDFRNAGHSSGSETFNIGGNYNQTGGTVTRTGTPSSSGVANIFFTAGPNRNFTQSGGAFTTNGLFNFTVNLGAELTLNNSINMGTPAIGTRTFTNNGTLWLGNHIIEGDVNTSFANTSAATVTLGVGHPQGIAVVADGNIGNIRTGTTRTYGILANYNYYGAAANTGNRFHRSYFCDLQWSNCQFNCSCHYHRCNRSFKSNQFKIITWC
jgi:hypothetical protein